MKKRKKIVFLIFGGIICAVFFEILKTVDNTKLQNEKLNKFYQVLVIWIRNKQNRISLIMWLKKNNYYNIAVYGGKELGELLISELSDSEIIVDYLIDRDKKNCIPGIVRYSPDDKLPSVDAIIVTAINYFEEICIDLSKVVNCPIWSLEDIVVLAGIKND